MLEAATDKMLEQMVEFPTHLKGNKLDLVLTNIPERVTEVAEAGRLGASDHVVILTKVITSPMKKEPAVRLIWGKADWAAMEQSLANESWEELDRLDADSAWNVLKEKINKLVEKHVPSRRRRNHDRPGWLNQNIVREIRRKKKLWRAAKQGVEVEKYKEAEKKSKEYDKKCQEEF